MKHTGPTAGARTVPDGIDDITEKIDILIGKIVENKLPYMEGVAKSFGCVRAITCLYELFVL